MKKPLMTRRHYRMFAAYIRGFRTAADGQSLGLFVADTLEQMIVKLASDDNPRFDEAKFRAACRFVEESYE